MTLDWQPLDPTPAAVVRVSAQAVLNSRKCSRCHSRPKARGQRWCKRCHADYMREYRVKAREELEHLREMARPGDESVSVQREVSRLTIASAEWATEELEAMERGRFWEKVKFSGGDSCWLWQGSKSRAGYGNARFGAQQTGAHRIAWEMANGPIPEGLCVLHKCDTPSCVRPDHLFLGTDADNVADKVAKGRIPKGETHWRSKRKAKGENRAGGGET